MIGSDARGPRSAARQRRRQWRTAVWLLAAAVPATGNADSMRCPGGLVVSGDAEQRLLARCGRPAERRLSVRRLHLGPGQWIDVTVKLWTFDFGPDRFARRVRIDDGIVTSIEALPR